MSCDDSTLLTSFVGTSVWDVTQLCMRMCIEEGMHRTREPSPGLIQEHIERRVFWECYLIDRYSSNTLDRPFAIADSDIHVGLPANANDDEIIAASARYPNLDAYNKSIISTAHNEMTVFFYCVRLRQISSAIPTSLSRSISANSIQTAGSNSDLLASGRLYTAVDKLLSRLQEWHKSAPIFQNPKCLYEISEWYDFLYARERLQVLRRAVDLAPKRRGIPPSDLLRECMQSAVRYIELFSSLLHRRVLTYTRSYFSTMFISGLYTVFCLSLGTSVSLEEQERADAIGALATCEKCLTQMGSVLPDAKH